MAQSKSKNLADASLEELMNVEVTSVSKKTQRLGATAASAFVITAEDIRRSGISVLPELLRLAPGVHVARLLSGTWAISIRGFNDEYSAKLLVLVDGRSVYSEVYDGVFWDTLNLAVDDIERIEVIRGPNAAIWGTNAVNGVINIITKSAKATEGGAVSLEAGSSANSNVSARYGGQTSSGTFYRVGLQNIGYDPLPFVGGDSPSRGWGSRSINFRVDASLSARDSLMVSGGAYDSAQGMVIPAATILAPALAPDQDHSINSGGNAVARWQHAFSDNASVEVRFSYDHSLFNDPQAKVRTTDFDYSFQNNLHRSRHDLIWGVTTRFTSYTANAGVALNLSPMKASLNETAIFGQDEIALIPNKLSLTAGMQVSRTATVGYAFQPTARLLWRPRDNLSTWIAISRAERTPSEIDRGLDYVRAPFEVATGSPFTPFLWAVPHVVGNPNARSETVLAYEAGQRVQATSRFSFDVSSFYNVYRHLISHRIDPPVLEFAGGMPYLGLLVSTVNEFHGESYGADLSATWNVNTRWKLIAGYDWLRVETRAYPGNPSADQLATSTATPHHQWQVRSNFDLTRTIQLDSALFYTAAMLPTNIPQHVRADLRIGWRPSEKIELSIGVQDVFDSSHPEYEGTRFDQTSLVPRNIYGKVTWRF